MPQNFALRKPRRSAAERARLVKLFRQSGSTIRQFAIDHGLNAGTFAQWLYRKDLAAVAEFQEVTVTDGFSGQWACEVTFSSGTVARLNADSTKLLVLKLLQSQRDSEC